MIAGVILGALPALVAVAAPRPAAVERPVPRPPDILLITVDTLRADALGFGGGRQGVTPTLDRLAAGGRVFRRAYAHNVVTLPSHANILTGVYPYQHGVRENSGFRLGEAAPTLATELRDAGYSTAAFVGAFPLDSQFGLDRGFEVYDDRYPKGSRKDEFVLAERAGHQVVEAAAAWWRRHAGRARFLWAHLFDPHAPYASSEEFAARFPEQPYLGEVAATDFYLEPLLLPFLEGRESPALIVFTADHGEALGEHGELTHGVFAYEATLRVPLVVWGAGVVPGIDDRLARHVDVFPTVLDAAGVGVEPGHGARLRGGSLLGPADDEASSYFEALSTTFNRGWAPLRGVMRGRHKLIALPLPELYDLAADPGEERNLFAEEQQLARELARLLPEESAVVPTRTHPPSAAELEKLRSLGYLSSTAPAPKQYGPGDDPKRLIDLDRTIHRVIELYSRGQAAQAVVLARGLVETRPSMPIGHSLLAQSLLEAGEIAEALDVMRRARGEGLASPALMRQLGLTMASAGQAAEAVPLLESLAADGDPRTLNALALALSEAGRQAEARAVLERLLKVDPDDPTAHERMSLVSLRTERWLAAREHARRAVEADPHLARAWNNLGVALYRLAQPEAALAAWRRAVIEDPSDVNALYNLGTRAREQGLSEEARLALARYLEIADPRRYAVDRERVRQMLETME